MTAQASGDCLPAELADEAPDALIAGGEAVGVHQILPDRHGVAATGEPHFDGFPVGFAGAGRGTATGLSVADSAPKSVVTSLAGFRQSGSTLASLAGFAGAESVITSLAGFAGAARPQAPGGRSATPASFR